jgi:hypothetical protein
MRLFAADASSWICSGVRMVEHVDESQPMAIDAQPAITPARSYAMQMRVQSMPLFAADASSWIDVTLLRRADGRARG